MSDPLPVVGSVYKYDLTNDVVTPKSTSDPGGNFDMDNVRSPNLLYRARTNDADDLSGFQITFGASHTFYGGSLINIELALTEQARLTMFSDAAWTTSIFNSAIGVATDKEIFTGHSLMHTQPTRPSWIGGVDNLTTGPTPAATPIPASVSVQSLWVDFSSKVSPRAYWECAFIALMENARALAKEIVTSSLRVSTARLRNGGTGYRLTVAWPYLPMTDVTFMRSLYQSSEGGDWPIFFFPNPGQKTTAGLITADRFSPASRGGLMRFLSWEDNEHELVGSTYSGTSCQMVCESWQEVPAEG